MIADYEGDISNLFDTEVEGEVPFLITRNLVMFPGVLTPVLIGRKQSLALVNAVKEDPQKVFAVFIQSMKAGSRSQSLA